MNGNGIMKHIILTLTILLLAGATALAQEHTRTVKESYKTTGDPEVIIDSRFGSVNVHTGSGDVVNVVVTVTVDAGSKERSRKLAEAARVEVKGNSEKVTVRTGLPMGMDEEDGAERNITIDVNVAVPSKSRVNLESKFGDVDVTGVRGSLLCDASFGSVEIKKCSNVRMQSSFGEITLAAIEGNLEAQGKMGNIIAYDIPGGRIASSYGDVEINGVGGRLEVTSSMGSVEIKGMRGGEITSSYGDVDVTLSKSFGGRIEASTSFGDIDSDYKLESKEKKRSYAQTGEKKYGTVGTGSDKLVIKSSFGDISIEKE